MFRFRSEKLVNHCCCYHLLTVFAWKDYFETIFWTIPKFKKFTYSWSLSCVFYSLKMIIESVFFFFFSVNKCAASIKFDAEGMRSTICLFIHANCQSITQRLKFEWKRENMLLNMNLGERMNGGRRVQNLLDMILSPYEFCLLTHASLITFVSGGINHWGMWCSKQPDVLIYCRIWWVCVRRCA